MSEYGTVSGDFHHEVVRAIVMARLLTNKLLKIETESIHKHTTSIANKSSTFRIGNASPLTRARMSDTF